MVSASPLARKPAPTAPPAASFGCVLGFKAEELGAALLSGLRELFDCMVVLHTIRAVLRASCYLCYTCLTRRRL
jgi:hypothetical protein